MTGKLFCVYYLLLAGIVTTASATDVNVFFNRKHTVGGVDSFQRSKFVTIHSANYEGLKSGGNDLMDYLINDLEVYYGRETGNFTTLSGSYPTTAVSACNTNRTSYASNTRAHSFENMQDLIVSGQYSVYEAFVAAAGDDIAQAGTNYGDFMSIFLSEACGTGGTSGLPYPEYLEVLNEPLWDPIDQYVLWQTTHPNRPTASEEIDILHEHFLFHRETARELHRQWPNAKVGGFAEAFPDPELRNYFNWENRLKTFIDSCGADMDFYSFHLYDFHCYGGTKRYRKGGNMEALMDLISQYNYLVHGSEKPFVITEYGARAHCEEDSQWNPYRDWLCASSINSMMVQFMDRPDMMGKAIPFIMAVWSQNWNIFRPDQSGAVFTDYIKMYELWDNVNGTRLFTTTSDLDMQVDAYTNGNNTYLILNNIEDNAVTVNIGEIAISEEDIISTRAKHFYWSGIEVKLDTLNFSGAPTELTVNGKATMILEYITASPPSVEFNAIETRNYATEYHKVITANTSVTFNINGLALADHGRATLRLGIGRDHGKSLQPNVAFNGTGLMVPGDYRGDNQSQRGSFFGMLEVEVPYELLQEDNTVGVEFSDAGGYINSAVLRVFNMDGDGVTVHEKVNEFISSNIKIYPNPATNILYVDFPSDYNAHYRIINLNGQVLTNNNFTGNSIDVSMLRNGLYLLKLETSNKVFIKRFSKSE